MHERVTFVYVSNTHNDVLTSFRVIIWQKKKSLKKSHAK